MSSDFDDDIKIDETSSNEDTNLMDKIIYVDEMDLKRFNSTQISNMKISNLTKNMLKKNKENELKKVLKNKEYIENFLNSESNRKKLMGTFENNKIFFTNLLQLIHKIDN